jgi:ubiquinone/menaquinone biosynthesis C-methylase UbiE
MRRARRVTLAVLVLAVVAAAGIAVSGYGARAASMLRALVWNLDLEAAMDAVGVAPGMVVGEAGAGDGYFTLPVARRLGSTGAVYANDISSRALDRLAASARREGLGNVHTVRGDVDDPRFPRRDLELVVIVHAFHDFSEPVEWLRNARKYLGPAATVAIIDRDPAQGAEGHFWSRERILGHAADAGFEPVKVVDDISKHLIVVLRPSR